MGSTAGSTGRRNVIVGSGERPIGDRFDDRQDGVAVDWLPQERHASGLLRAFSDGVSLVPGGHDDRQLGPFLAEFSLEVEARHTGQVHVDDEAEPRVILPRRDECFGAREQIGFKPVGLQQPAERAAFEIIVLDDGDVRRAMAVGHFRR